MNRKLLALTAVLAVPSAGLWVAGCGDDEVFRDQDASVTDDGAVPDVTTNVDGGALDGAVGLGCGNATGSPARLLLSVNRSTEGELAAFNLQDRKVDGFFTYPGAFGTSWSQGTDPYVLAQQTDVVTRMNAQRPWEPVSSWSVRGDDATDGGSAYADPTTVVVPDCRLGYVLRFKRNKIAVIDTTRVADGGAPERFVDLSSLVQPNDRDGLVDMTSAVHVASKKRIYVLLGNEDLSKVAGDGFTALCADTTPSIVALDSETGAVVSLGGTAPGGGIALGGYNPPLGASLVYDAARDRLLVLSAGCNADNGGAAGAVQRRRVEEVDLATGQVKTLLSLDDQGFPGGMVYVDGTRAAITFFGAAFQWNPTQTTLGAEIPGGLDFASSDGKGNLLGARATYLVDGGAGPLEIVSVPAGDGGTDAGVTKLGESPFSTAGGFLNGAETWPRP